MSVNRADLQAWADSLAAPKREEPQGETKKREVAFKAAAAERQVVYGEVYTPGVIDSQGDVMNADEVCAMAWRFIANGHVAKIDVQHDNEESGAVVVESFIARADDPVFAPGAWVLGVHVPSARLWGAIKDGKINGFSLQALVHRKASEMEITVPDQIEGDTESAADHSHRFIVQFDEAGNFVGGRTSVEGGHYHEITRGSATDAARDSGGVVEGDKHTHRFHFVDALLEMQSAD